MKKWDKEQRFDTALDWINASNARRAVKLDDDVMQALAKCCIKRSGVWRMRKTEPKDSTAYMAFKAFHIARHAAQWGNLAPWTEGFTARLMQANDADRDLFDRAFDQFGNVKKTR